MASVEKNQKIQGRLLLLAALFLGGFSFALTISPATRARSWEVEYRWLHWIGYLVWLGGFWILHRSTLRWIPNRDPFLLPILATLSGWGLLTIWRLTTYYGMRQTLWLALALLIFILGLRLPSDLYFLRRYKYVLLTGGLLLTALTLIFGTNPMGYGPRMWLGCCGVYLQPSEPLKLLLIIFLAAYFTDWQAMLKKKPKSKDTAPLSLPENSATSLQILIPTFVMTGVALLLLLVQRDLGTASIFILIFAVTVYLATSWRWVPVITTITLLLAGILGYQLFDVVQLRIEAWLNPWLDPTGRSYQIVQSLIAVANGGIFGRGPGIGNPTLVPVSHSDFIYVAIGEETGLIGMIGILALLGLLLQRGMKIALKADNTFHQLLAASLSAFLIIQSVLIMGGNLRLLPLTGVTLPFVSYGGSSLVVSMIVGLLLVQLSGQTNDQQRTSNSSALNAQILPVTSLTLGALVAVALAAGWWAFVRAPDLITRTDNARRSISDRYVYRGSLVGRGDSQLVETTGQPGELDRNYIYPSLGPITGHNHPVYGQSGLEASLDPTLRGLAGNDLATIWWHRLLYGQPPPGLNVRLTIDLNLQALADKMLAGHQGALVLLNAATGEILVMASHPGYDPNLLDDTWDHLLQDPAAPLINRVTQGVYPSGDLAGLPFMQAAANPEVSQISIRLPLADSAFPEEVTPLEIAFAAASLSNQGTRPAARLALSYQHPEQGWLIFPPLGSAARLLSQNETAAILNDFQTENLPIWQIISVPTEEELTWYLGGSIPATLPQTQTNDTRQGFPVTLILVLEEENLPLAEEIGRAVLSAAIGR